MIILTTTVLTYLVRFSSAADRDEQSSLDLSIERDENFHKVFYGIDYTPPFGGQFHEGCYLKQQDVIDHIKILSQLTTRVRIYGMDCLLGDFVLNAIRLLNVDMTVVLTVWEENDVKK